MADPNFGVFEPLFGEGSGYLTLLHLDGPKAAESVALIVYIARTSPPPFDDIELLFSDRNWRPHLVGAVALCAVEPKASAVSKLWRAIDTGSWVTPQLTVVAFLCDPRFVEEATARLDNLCLVDPTLLLQMNPLERHSAAGPAGSLHRSAKAAASLLQLLNLKPECAALVSRLLSNAELTQLVQSDFDNSAEITTGWLKAIKSALPD